MQLPADIADFTGREVHVEELCRLLSVGRSDDNPGAVPVALVAGAGGLGKTTLAIHAAHRMRAQYPDGVLYVDLLGANPQSLAPADVLARFLRDLGVRETQIPVREEERGALYRTRLNGRMVDEATPAGMVDGATPAGMVDEGQSAGTAGGAQPDGTVDEGQSAGTPGAAQPDGMVDEAEPAGMVDEAKPAGMVDEGTQG